MKRMQLIFLVSFFFCIFGLISCGKIEDENMTSSENITSVDESQETSKTECTHEFGEWVEVFSATCIRNGLQRRTCTFCEATEKKEILALGHDKIHNEAKYPTKEETGWTEYTSCSRCHYISGRDSLPCVTLEYEIEEDGTCKITGIGTYTGGNLIIPSKIGEAVVTSIGYYAFRDCQQIRHITIPEGVSIQTFAFLGCTRISSATIPADLIDSIPQSSLRSVTIESGVYICEEAFMNRDNLNTVVMCEGIKMIGEEAFFNCDNLESVYIPSSVQYIGTSAFSEAPQHIYYGGTKEAWEEIMIGFGNELDSAIVHYNCNP